jgi:hypothetical protein
MRLVSMSDGAEVLEHIQASLPRLFWVKLHSEELVALDRRGKATAVFTTGCRRVRDWRAKRVCEVNERCRRDPAKEP